MTDTKDAKEFQKAFEFHGVTLSKGTNGQMTGDCPFCGKDRHFYVKAATGEWDCKSCEASGNLYTFLRLTHKRLADNTNQSDLRELSKLRPGLTAKTLGRYGLAYCPDREAWIIPVNNFKGKLANLRVWVPNGRKVINYNTPCCVSHLYLADRIKPEGRIWVCEGEWDAMALEYMLRMADHTEDSVVAVPGATTFLDSWPVLLAGRDVNLVYDNDESGRKGMERATRILQSSTKPPKSIKVIRWPDALPDKYDLRDFVRDHKGGLKDAWVHLQDLMLPVAEAPKAPGSRLTRETFEEVLQDFEDEIHVTDAFRVSLAVCLACAFAVRLPGDPVWTFVVGPPGSGKTLLLSAFGISEYTESISKLTPRTLVSGWKSEDGSDASFLPQLNGKVLVIKDYTAIKSMPSGEQEELYGVLRDAYDGSLKNVYGNKEIREFSDFTFGIIAGVTDVIHGDQRATLGERFLKVELLDNDYNPDDQILSAMRTVFEKPVFSDKLRKSVLGFLDKKIDLNNLPTVPEKMERKIASLAQVVGHLRATVQRDRGKDMQYRPRPEIGSRVGIQLKKLGICLCIVLGKEEADDEVYRYLYQVALDTAKGFNLEICERLAIYQEEGVSAKALERALSLSKSTINRKLADLHELLMVVPSEVGSPRGKPSIVWRLSDTLQTYWDTAKPPPKRKKRRRRG